MTSLKTSIKTITYLSDIGCLEIQGASLDLYRQCFRLSLYFHFEWENFGSYKFALLCNYTH
ncbi:hypothetical protein UG47_12430 [Escherichia coli]|nr:hypothetical protein UG47_12430 [Escherichia coli]